MGETLPDQNVESFLKNLSVANISNSEELVIDLRDLTDMEESDFEVSGRIRRAAKRASKGTRSSEVDQWPAFLRRCGIVDERAIAPGLHDGEPAFPLGCGRWEYEMFAEQFFGPQCLGALVNRVAGRVLVTSRTQALYPTRVHWSVCHGWCRDPRVAHTTCLASPNKRRPMYENCGLILLIIVIMELILLIITYERNVSTI